MSTKKISELETTSAVSTSDLMETAIPSGSSYASKKMSIAQLATYLENSVVHSALDTQNKTIIDAINELKSICDSLSASHFIVTNQLPTSDINMNAIYLIPKQSTGVNDVYEEYICLDDTTTPAIWEKIGETQIDLSNYITFDDADIATTSKNGSMSKGDKSKLNGIDSGAQVNVQSDWNVTDTSSDAFIQHKPSVNKVKQSPIASTNADYPLLLTYSANGTEETNTVWKNTNITYNPSTNTFNVRNGTVKAYTGQYSELVSTFIGFMSGSTLLAYFSPNPNQASGTTVEAVMPATSGTLALQSELPTEAVEWSEMNVLGAKNLLPFPYLDKTVTKNGITFTPNDDYSVTVSSGSPNANTNWYYIQSVGFLSAGKYIVSGYNDTNQGNAFCLRIVINQNMSDSRTYNDYGEGVEITVNEGEVISIYLHMGTSGISNGKKHFAMIRPSTVSDATYQEPTLTNRQLTVTKLDISEIASVENSNTASQAYAVGDYMIWRGGFYRVVSAISSGGVITLNTNVTKTTLGAELKRALT